MINKISLGTAQFGLDYGINNFSGQTKELEVSKILQRCKNVGIMNIDTASSYGNAENVLGKVISSKQLGNYFKITTKFKGNEKLDLADATKKSLKRLRVPKLYAQMFHSFKEYNASIGFKRPENVLKMGVSIYSNEELLKVIQNPNIKVIQCPFNLLDNDSIRGEALAIAKEKGIEVHVRSAFLQGLFFMDRDSLPNGLLELKHHLDLLDNICKDYQLSMSELAIGYCLSKVYIDKVVIGVESLNQLNLNIRAIERPFLVDLEKMIDNISVGNKKLLNPTNW